MMRKMFFMLFLAVIGAASVNAQVTIGKDAPAHDGAVLDLSQGKKEMGLLLPRIGLKDVKVLQVADANASKIDALKTSATGMFVYNTSAATIGGNGIGLYVWNGNQWCAIAVDGLDASAMLPVIDWDQAYTTADDASPHTFSVHSISGDEPTTYKWSSKSDDGVTVKQDLDKITGNTADLEFSGTGDITLTVIPVNSYGEGTPVPVTIKVSHGTRPAIDWVQKFDKVDTSNTYTFTVTNTGTSAATSYEWSFVDLFDVVSIDPDLSTITGNTAKLKFSGLGTIQLRVVPINSLGKGGELKHSVTVAP